MGEAASHEVLPEYASQFAGTAGGAALVAAAAASAQKSQFAAARQSGDASSDGLIESALLSQLVQLLAQRSGHSLLLSDLGALLPGPMRHGVKEKGGLRSWLQKYPELFQVSGQPGKENVMLLLGQAEPGTSPVSSPPADAEPSRTGIEVVQSEYFAQDSQDLRKKEEEEDNDAAVQLRGLPYRATVTDVKAFFGRHAANFRDDNAVQLVLNRDGRPSGFARVQFTSPEAARAAKDEKHMKLMEVSGAASGPTSPTGAGSPNGDRYVEIFLYTERPNKLRFKRLTNAVEAPKEELESVDVLRALSVTKEQIVNECRIHMLTPGKGQLLLSMLGVALSTEARLYLKKTDQGLKHFLAQYPEEFSVEGAKGRECITYLPAVPGLANSDLPINFSQAARENQKERITNVAVRKSAELTSGPSGPVSGSISDLQRPPPSKLSRWEDPGLLPESPKVTMPHEGHGMATPSDWGTPQLGLHWGSTAEAKPGPLASDATAAAALNPWTTAQWAMPPATAYWGNAGMMGHWPPGMMPRPWASGAADQNAVAVAAAASDAAAAMHAALLGAMPPLGDGSTMTSQTASSEFLHRSLAAAMASGSLGWPMPPPMAMAVPTPTQPPAVARPNQQNDPVVALRLRGLPYTAKEQDVFAFFAKHDVVEFIAECPQAVRMVTKTNGKPLGQAIVQMNSFADAEVATELLNGKYMDSRYIEVFHHRENDAQSADQSPQAGPFDGASDTGGSGGATSTQATPQSFSFEAFAANLALQNQAKPAPWDDLFSFMKQEQNGRL